MEISQRNPFVQLTYVNKKRGKVQMTSKHMKNCLASLSIREKQIKTTLTVSNREIVVQGQPKQK
jgi:hypothetical protein